MTTEEVSPGKTFKLIANSITRVRWSAAKLNAEEVENGARTNVTESSATAREEFSSKSNIGAEDGVPVEGKSSSPASGALVY